MKHLCLFAFVIVSLGCSEVVPGTCYLNPTGGAGGADTIPIGAGVGAAASGDYATEPPRQPEDANDPPPGCTMLPANTYIDCRARRLAAPACSEVCIEAGAYCVPFAVHPYKSGLEPGKLTYCKNGSPSYTCTYTFSNGDGCVLNSVAPRWLCVYAGE